MAQSTLGNESKSFWKKDMKEWTMSLALEEKFVGIGCWYKKERNRNMNKILIAYIIGLIVGAGSTLFIVEQLLK